MPNRTVGGWEYIHLQIKKQSIYHQETYTKGFKNAFL